MKNLLLFIAGIYFGMAILVGTKIIKEWFENNDDGKTLVIGKCYQGTLGGHFNKNTYTQKILKLDSEYVLSGQCNDTECREEGHGTEEDTVRSFKLFYPIEVNCP